jgi:hypothetical protein
MEVANSLPSTERLELPSAGASNHLVWFDEGGSEDGALGQSHLGTVAKRFAVLLLPVALAACASGEDVRETTMAVDVGGGGNQPFPSNYRTELLAFMKTYLNNPVGVRDAALAEPVQRTVGGRLRYVTCVRFTPREPDGSYRDVRERAVLYVNGRLDRVVENSSEACAGALYAAFPDLEKLTR